MGKIQFDPDKLEKRRSNRQQALQILRQHLDFKRLIRIGEITLQHTDVIIVRLMVKETRFLFVFGLAWR